MTVKGEGGDISCEIVNLRPNVLQLLVVLPSSLYFISLISAINGCMIGGYYFSSCVLLFLFSDCFCGATGAISG